MTMLEDGPLFLALRKLRADWPIREWSWDDRMEMVTSAFGKEHFAQSQGILEVALPHRFSRETIAGAPAELLAVVESSRGIRGNQLAFCGGGPDLMAFGLWWPWGSGDTVSLRIGLVGTHADDAMTARLRELFEVG